MASFAVVPKSMQTRISSLSWIWSWARTIGDNFIHERDRWPLWLPVLFAIGIAVYFQLLIEPPIWLGITIFLCGTIAVFGTRHWRQPQLLVIAGTVLVFGFIVAQWRTVSVEHLVLSERHGPASVTGQVSRVEQFPDSLRITIDKARISGLGAEKTPGTVRIRMRGQQPTMQPGEWLRVRAIISPPAPPAAPGAFDFQRLAYFQQIGAFGFSIGTAEIIAPGASRFGLELSLSRFRQALSTRIRNAVGGDAGGVAAALMIGDRSGIPEDVLTAFRDSGLAHLLAISGLHIGLMASILFFGVRALLALIPGLALRQPIKKWAAGIAILGAFAYAIIAGATIPSQRAFLMIGLVLLAVILDRRGISMRLVAWAAFIILLFQPESLLSASFQMSFAAVVALIAGYEAIRGRGWFAGEYPSMWRRPAVYLISVAITTVIASTATAPFAVFHFNRVAMFALAANLLAVPLTALWIMPAALISFILMPFGVEGIALIPEGWGITAVIAIARAVAGWSGAVIAVPAVPLLSFSVVVLGGLWLCLWRRRWRLAGLAPILIGVMTFGAAPPPDILVDNAARLFAVRLANGNYALSSQRAARFSGEIWRRRAGIDAAEPTDWPDRTTTNIIDALHCDGLGCIYRHNQKTVALVRDFRALHDDCHRVDIIVSAVPVRSHCPSAKSVIDRFDLWRDGAHAIWIGSNGQVRIESVQKKRGIRPWVLRKRGP